MTSIDDDKKISQDTQDWQNRVVMMLAILAKEAKIMGYDEFAHAADIPAPHRIHKLTAFLEELIAEDVSQSAPIRAAVIVSKVSRIPAAGFFLKLEDCGCDKAEDEGRYHQALLKALNPAFG